MDVTAPQSLSQDPIPTFAVRRLEFRDLTAAMRAGFGDFLAKPSHNFFLALIYPVIGAALVAATSGGALLPLVFPLLAGFALIGPIAAVGLFELSRRRELGEDPTWRDALAVLRGPSLVPILTIAGALLAIFVAWLATAWAIHGAIMGPEAPSSIRAFLAGIYNAPEGLTLILVGNGAGMIFAILAMSISVFSLPLLLDGERRASVAAATSVKAVAANPAVMAGWGVLVAGTLTIAALPAFIGLAVALPVLAHATWRLYRRAIVRQPQET